VPAGPGERRPRVMGLLMRGRVVAVEPTKGGAWDRVLIGTGKRVNDVVMVPRSATVPAKVGAILELPVRASVETTAEGRPTRFITYWYDDGKPRAAGGRNGGGDDAA